MNSKGLEVGHGAHEGDTIPCTHCGYENPRPQVQMMKSVKALLCRRCQKTFSLEKDDAA